MNFIKNATELNLEEPGRQPNQLNIHCCPQALPLNEP
jgi:hypothetical protein